MSFQIFTNNKLIAGHQVPVNRYAGLFLPYPFPPCCVCATSSECLNCFSCIFGQYFLYCILEWISCIFGLDFSTLPSMLLLTVCWLIPLITLIPTLNGKNGCMGFVLPLP